MTMEYPMGAGALSRAGVGATQGGATAARLPLRPDPRALFDPTYTPAPAAAEAPVAPVGRLGLRGMIREIAAVWNGFYRHRLSYVALIATSLMLCYVGGAAMFWFHAVELGEGGPAISWYAHWTLDSTFGFIALTPALAVIIPLSAWIAGQIGGGLRPRLLPWLYAVVAGAIFAVVTIPGPLAHDLLVGRGTWIANEATALVGNPNQPLTPVSDYPVLAALTQQLGAAVPIYLGLSLFSVLLLRRMVGLRRAVAARGSR